MLVGFLVGLLALAIPIVLTLVFAFVLGAPDALSLLVIFVPTLLVAFVGVRRSTNEAWRRGLSIGLGMSGIGSLIFGIYALIPIALLALGYWLGARSAPGIRRR